MGESDNLKWILDMNRVVYIADKLLDEMHEFGDDTDAYARTVERLDDALRKLGMGSAKFEAPSDAEFLAKVEREAAGNA